MTRINAGVAPSELKRAHLIAEWREITMVPAALKRSLHSKSINEVLRSIPNDFTLNSGHVKFFYDKLAYLKQRMGRIEQEMHLRDYEVDLSRYMAFDGLPEAFYGKWQETESARKIVQERIALRISEKPHLYQE